MTRAEAVAIAADAIDAHLPDALIVVCNGMIGRELFTHRDRPGRFYMIGSMGLASSIGLGLALTRPARPVVVFDGDGNVLMGLGVLASVAAAAPFNLFHFVFDNAAHGSTGGQRTISDRVPLDRVALAAGYKRSDRVRSAGELQSAMTSLLIGPGPGMLVVDVEPGNLPNIGRVDVAPVDLTARFRTACAAS
jgi:thiamine pyrophosphate-dependent acetolactate synthase large subunit-like protein